MESEFTLPYLHCWILVINKSTSALPFCIVMRHFIKLTTFHQLLNFSRIPIIHLFQLVIIFQRKEKNWDKCINQGFCFLKWQPCYFDYSKLLFTACVFTKITIWNYLYVEKKFFTFLIGTLFLHAFN